MSNYVWLRELLLSGYGFALEGKKNMKLFFIYPRENYEATFCCIFFILVMTGYTVSAVLRLFTDEARNKYVNIQNSALC